MLFMAGDKFILIGLDDERAKEISEVLGNKTCKKIIDYLAETKEASEQDVSNGLGMPINTIEYNLGKLVKSGLVEKAKNFFWSVKGKKIEMYKLARKHIVISPRLGSPSLSKLKSILPAVILSGFAALIVKLYLQSVSRIEYYAAPESLKAASSVGAFSGNVQNIFALPEWAWFLAGAVIAVIIFSILNWRKL